MSIYKVISPGHGLVAEDLLFGGEYFHASVNLQQIRFRAYREDGTNKGFVFLPLTWLVANLEISTVEESRDSVAERTFRGHLGGRQRFGTGGWQLPPFGGPVAVVAPLTGADRICSDLGDLYNNGDKTKFVKEVNQWIDTLPPRTVRGSAQIILLTDRMSGDSRLVGFYGAYNQYPVLYIVTRSNLGRHDMGVRYLADLGVHVLRFAADDAHKTYGEFNVHLNRQVRKGANLTGDISDLLEAVPNVHNPLAPNGPAFRRTAQSLVHAPEVPPALMPLLQERRPILVIWTKAKVVPTLFKGRPEHLLGKTGTQQVCELGRNLNFSLALAGDLEPTPAIRSLIDHDLRYTCGGLSGLSMKAQYGVLQHINVYVPLVHLSMRSGNIEPLPLLGMRTVYMEELGNHQGGRMQKLEASTKGFYDRHVFLVPPTIKGRLREMVTYFYDWNFRQAVKGTQVETEMVRLLNVLITKVYGYSKEFASLEAMLENRSMASDLWGFFDGVASSDDGLVRLKSWISREEFPKGFSKEDLYALKAKLERLRAEASILLALGKIKAIKAAVKL